MLAWLLATVCACPVQKTRSRPPIQRSLIILVTRASDRPKALGNSTRTCAVGFLQQKIGLFEPYANMNAPIRDAFDCSSRKPMRRHFVSGFPRALLSLSQEKSSGVEIGL